MLWIRSSLKSSSLRSRAARTDLSYWNIVMQDTAAFLRSAWQKRGSAAVFLDIMEDGAAGLRQELLDEWRLHLNEWRLPQMCQSQKTEELSSPKGKANFSAAQEGSGTVLHTVRQYPSGAGHSVR